jgi:hypothetical protein
MRIRHEGIGQLDLYADDRVEAGLVRRCGEADHPVEALAVGQGKAAETQLGCPGH